MMLLVNEKGIEQPGGSDGEGVAVVLANPLDPAPGGFIGRAGFYSPSTRGQVARTALGDRARAQAGRRHHVQSRRGLRIDLYALI